MSDKQNIEIENILKYSCDFYGKQKFCLADRKVKTNKVISLAFDSCVAVFGVHGFERPPLSEFLRSKI